MRLLVRGLALVAALATMTAAAHAQQNSLTTAAGAAKHAAAAGDRSGSGDEGKAKANDKAYNAALKNLPDKQYDPWRGVR
jgi:hypothetical protein